MLLFKLYKKKIFGAELRISHVLVAKMRISSLMPWRRRVLGDPTRCGAGARAPMSRPQAAAAAHQKHPTNLSMEGRQGGKGEVRGGGGVDSFLGLFECLSGEVL